ncbi:pantothenate transporter [Phyllosticta citriasiana]|uniref:Pantothenate transporter n=1 Tax=Phyllosticta citriasiana TaxID=595635 RepID=A0ABR1KCA0_9PEZI
MTFIKASRVAVIGAGLSGSATAAYLKKEGVEVTVFERRDSAGGVWVYDENPPPEPDYPSEKASLASDPSKTSWKGQVARNGSARAPAGPCYRDLKNNVPIPLMTTALLGFPQGTPEFTSHTVIASYIQDIVKAHGIEQSIRFRTLVENAEKVEGKWELTIANNVGQPDGFQTTEGFDAIVVATGHYHAPRVPDIPGLRHWKTKWPSRVIHSKSYRTPEEFKNKNVLLIGAGTSSTDIAKEIGPLAKKIWQSARGGDFDFPAALLPENATRIGEIQFFDSFGPETDSSDSENASQPESDSFETGSIPGIVTLKSGHKLCDVDQVIVCTGYHVSLPFLKAYHEDETPPEKADERVIVTDGTQYHNLHKDIFYIPDPTLAFVGVPYFTATFVLFDFQAKVVATVLSGNAELPERDAMREEYGKRVETKGFRKKFHSLKGQDVEYVNELLDWVNADLARRNRDPIQGHTDEFKTIYAGMTEKSKFFGRGSQLPPPTITQAQLGECRGAAHEDGETWSTQSAGGMRREKLKLSLCLDQSFIIVQDCAGSLIRNSGTARCLFDRLEIQLLRMSDAADREQSAPVSRTNAVVKEDIKYDWRSAIWDTFNKSPEERKFLFKLDAALLTFASLGYFIKYLDQANINSAFVSGMKEDLGLYGDQLNIMQTCWTVGYVIGQLPSNIVLTKVRPSIWIPAMELLWTILTFCLSQAKTPQQIYAIRFLVGLAESTFYPGMQYIIGSWYRKDELAKRSCIFHTSSSIATMFSGYLMAAVYNLGGKGGYRGWQWLFIVDGIISLPVALLGFIVLPDIPEISKPFYLKPEELELAKERMKLEGRKPRAPYTKQKIKKILSSWHIWSLTLLYIAFNNGNNNAQPVFAQWLKWLDAKGIHKYTVAQINAIPTTTNGLAVFSTLVYAWSSDTYLKGARWPPMIFAGIFNMITYISLAIWDIPWRWHWTCYILAGLNSGLSGLCFAWAHEICAGDNEERAIVVGSMNEMAYVVQAWLPLIVWKQTDAPMYRKGNITVAIIGGPLLIGSALLTLYLRRRELKRYAGYEPLLQEDASH